MLCLLDLDGVAGNRLGGCTEQLVDEGHLEACRSIGGGCSEAAVLGEARSLIGSGRYKVVHVDLTGEAAEDEGMVCGGIMDVLVEDFATDREPCDR